MDFSTLKPEQNAKRNGTPHVVYSPLVYQSISQTSKMLSWQIRGDYNGHPHSAGDLQIPGPETTDSRALQVLPTGLPSF